MTVTEQTSCEKTKRKRDSKERDMSEGRNVEQRKESARDGRPFYHPFFSQYQSPSH